MKRKEFLKGAGIFGLGLAFNGKAKSMEVPGNPDCILVPTETAGPFPLDLTENSFFFRQDITEGKEGIPLKIRMKVFGVDNCEPMQNVRVHIWHCDKDGVYSGYNTGSNPGDVNATEFRGYQIADAHGEVEFDTILPGWYPGRICHMHFQVYVSSSYSAVSQFTFPLDLKNTVYNDNLDIYPKGVDPLTFNTDGAFVDGVDQQLASLELNPDGDGLISYYEVFVRGSGTSGVGHLERAAAKIIEVDQNYPNPYTDITTLRFNLKASAKIQLELWNLNGKKVANVMDEFKSNGIHQIIIDLKQFGLPLGNYIYQFVISCKFTWMYFLCEFM
ncbi:MAG: T9SS type A sorting domain-containing protein, partial [Bacteroidota bacterium]